MSHGKIDWVVTALWIGVAVCTGGFIAAEAFKAIESSWEPPVGQTAERLGEVEIVAGLAAKYFGEAEVTMTDRTRCDLLTDVYAFEADWAAKWAEGVGQSVHYALLTGRAPGLILLTRDAKADAKHIERARRVCGELHITIFVEVIK